MFKYPLWRALGSTNVGQNGNRWLPYVVFLTLFGGDALRNSINWVGWAIVCAIVATWSVAVVIRRRAFVLRKVPIPLALLLLEMVLSFSWSSYRSGTALGLFTQMLTTVAAVAVFVVASWNRTVKALGWSLRMLVVLSLAFEVIVSTVIRKPFCPVYVDCSGNPPAAFYWSRDALFTGGQIQGLPGNSNLLAIYALLALVITLVQRFAKQLGPISFWSGVTTSLAALALTRSSTVFFCAIAAGLSCTFLIAARRNPAIKRGYLGSAAALTLTVGALAAWLEKATILNFLGKHPDLTGRAQIWADVSELARQKPFFGWGWTGWWQPWLKPFATLAERNGVVYLQAHNAYLDMWFQLGVVGLALFLAFLATATVRGWRWALVKSGAASAKDASKRLQILPILLLVILIVHGITESRINVEWGWSILVLLSLQLSPSRRIRPVNQVHVGRDRGEWLRSTFDRTLGRKSHSPWKFLPAGLASMVWRRPQKVGKNILD